MGVATKERPILFKGEMVRVILPGIKTQTRRIVKGIPDNFRFNGFVTETTGDYAGKFIWSPASNHKYNMTGGVKLKCPYGNPGDQLWVRETFAYGVSTESGIAYKATSKWDDFEDGTPYNYEDITWKPSIHMPRWASRIQLEITNIRVERLQAISGPDAIAEGVIMPEVMPQSLDLQWSTAQSLYQALWKSINGHESWEQDPYVWVIEFKQLEVNHG